MTPAARVAAAIEILDEIAGGAAAEPALTGWARRHRFAGSGDRAAIRDHVYDALRCWRSFGWLGGAETGRGLMIGALRAAGRDPEEIFTGHRFAPQPLDDRERRAGSLDDAPEGVRLDIPDWLLPDLRESLGTDLPAVARVMQSRAPLFLRANAGRTTAEAAREALAAEGIAARPHHLSPWALEVTGNPRRLQQSRAYADGLVEVQDAASQAVCAALPLMQGATVLDYCAGGGGKALALAARGARVTAHDAAYGRMRDLPPRAARAGVSIEILNRPPDPARRFDVVLCDVPCSGSGTWRRTPQAKWQLTAERVRDLTAIQAEILDTAARHVRPQGTLAYVTCSMLRAENETQVSGFLDRHDGWSRTASSHLTPLDGGDGFYWVHLQAP